MNIDAQSLLLRLPQAQAVLRLGIVSVVLIAAVVLWDAHRRNSHFAQLKLPSASCWRLRSTFETLTSGHKNLNSTTAENGHTYRVPVFPGTYGLITQDPLAISSILADVDTFHKPWYLQRIMSFFAGGGLVFTNGATHRRQRKAVAHNFSTAVVASFMPVIYTKAEKLRQKLLSPDEEDTVYDTREQSSLKTGRSEVKPVNIYDYTQRLSMDVSGMTGFGLDLGALEEVKHELAGAYRQVFTLKGALSIRDIVQIYVPGLSWLAPTPSIAAALHSRALSRRVGNSQELIRKRRNEFLNEFGDSMKKTQRVSKDFLSLLVKSTMAKDLSPDLKLSHSETLDQISTLFAASFESTATTTAQILYKLAEYPDLQERLRREVMDLDDAHPDLATLSSLPLLDAVVKESIRVEPIFPRISRVATKDTTLQFSTPLKGRDGDEVRIVFVPKGSVIFLSLLSLNTDPAIWGPTAAEFDPQRFLDSPTGGAAEEIPSVWANVASFGAGPRHCAGFRFALGTVKATVFTLLRELRFELLPQPPVLTKRSLVSSLPYIEGKIEQGAQLPLLVYKVGEDHQ